MVRLILSILLGAVVAFTLFVVMAKLIENTNRPAEEIELRRSRDEAALLRVG